MARTFRQEALRFDFEGGEARPEPELSAFAAPPTPIDGAGLEPAAGSPGREDAARSERTRAMAGPEGALSVAQFYDVVRAALAGAFPGEVWVTGEIRNLKESKGHRFIELADHDTSNVPRPVQQLEVVCWSREWQRIAAELAHAGTALAPGRVVRVRGKVSAWEGAGKLRLAMTALDVEALLGGIAAARQRLLRQLAEDGLFDANRQLALSPVPLRIGVVTSEGSEAHRDFAGCLERSPFAFELRVERSLVQGAAAPWQLAGALKRLARAGCDLVVVVRGGGGRGDLAAFDSEQVARAIAASPIPVWVGVGHTGDRSVADEVAHACFPTPTACGEAVVGRVAAYWSGIERATSRLAQRGSSELRGAEERLGAARAALSSQVRHQLDRRAGDLDVLVGRVAGSTGRRLDTEGHRLIAAAEQLARCGRDAASDEAHAVRRWCAVLGAYDPRRQLERGWSLTRDAEGRLVRSVENLRTGDAVLTRLADGELRARVDELRPDPTGPAGAPEAMRHAPSGAGQAVRR